MNPYFEEFLEEFSPQLDPVKIKAALLEKYKNVLPQAMLDFWSEVGWSGYANGIMWSTDPEEFEPALAAWLDGSNLLSRDKYTVIARSAFGKLFVWGKATGLTIIINPLISSITTVEPTLEAKKSDSAISAFFLSKDKEDFDFDDQKDKPMFARAFKKLGPLKSDEMYAFEPALSIGGTAKIENLVKVKMIEHLVLLSQFGPAEFTHIDVSRHI
ncbi:hypothetical protein JOD97_000873 [Duganella sp. 1411]|uniref:GAD-like domain-containing protein n=1 Tax=Duganella sp. 1411 TaxID=2806572 RepID=UPI001AE98BD2|nr:GAD-like domain-containing protein [Duganella sp. 1411]MBP1202859.1 hypothetical protein [Duganella sp. 1411]